MLLDSFLSCVEQNNLLLRIDLSLRFELVMSSKLAGAGGLSAIDSDHLAACKTTAIFC